MKKILIPFALLLFASLGLGIAIFMELTHYASHPIHRKSMERRILIPPGQQFETTLKHLYAADLIKHPVKFRFLARFKGYDKRIKAGEYLLSTDMTPTELLEKLVSGKVTLYRLTIPEGYNLNQVASAVESAGWGNQADFLSLTKDSVFIKELGFDLESLEGYLFPETYHFPKDVGMKKIISTMTQRFKTIFTPQWEKRAKALGFTVHEVVTLASIIEKETGAGFERPIIASVFHNRLKKKMRLESDPTVIYGLEDYDGNITRKHLNTLTPYNTYKIKGLPPGPIANPGRKSIEAVLFPADTKYLFFVSKKDGTHHFSQTVTEHNRAVRKYQLSR